MSVFNIRKNKITLADYNYRQDIENRLFVADLSIAEVDVFREIINGSLKTTLAALVENLNILPKELKVILEKLANSSLFKIQGDTIVVDKERRKYYESQIIKFESDFCPDLEYVQGLLSKVPIHALPVWYALPRNSDNIFHSIVEKFLITPRTYERYLQDLTFDDPILSAIVKEIFSAPDYKISSRKLIEKFKLSREQFEEHMLLLEFSFVCCISYSKSKKMWEEVVTPFHEWREYQMFIKNTDPQIIQDEKNIKRLYTQEFGFLNELNEMTKNLLKKPLPSKGISPQIIHAASLLKIASVEKQKVLPTSHTQEWLDKTLTDQAIILYRQSLKNWLGDEQNDAFSEKDIREVEKSLKRIIHGKWVFFEDFTKGCLAAVGNTLPVHLQNKGKRWKYCIPQYQEKELDFIRLIACEYLMQAGVVETGFQKDKLCLCLTALGRQIVS